jgi:hypothetical protein
MSAQTRRQWSRLLKLTEEIAELRRQIRTERRKAKQRHAR